MKRSSSKVKQIQTSKKPKVFVIFGQNVALREKLFDLLDRLDVEIITLENIPKHGSPTIIEMLEKWIPKVDAIVSLMTPDDEGRLKGTRKLQPRARQNVVFETGCLILGRGKTIIIEAGGLEHLSDMEGIHVIRASKWNNEVEWKTAKRLSEILPSITPVRALHFTNYAEPTKSKKSKKKQYYHWQVFLPSPIDAIRDISSVTYKLHKTFPKPIQFRDKPKSKFALTTNGWGEFPIQIQVKFRNGKSGNLVYDLDLSRRWPGLRNGVVRFSKAPPKKP